MISRIYNHWNLIDTHVGQTLKQLYTIILHDNILTTTSISHYVLMIVSNIHDDTDCNLNIHPNSGHFPYKDITLQSCLLVLGMNDTLHPP